MGRKPIGDQAMSAAERQARHRRKLERAAREAAALDADYERLFHAHDGTLDRLCALTRRVGVLARDMESEGSDGELGRLLADAEAARIELRALSEARLEAHGRTRGLRQKVRHIQNRDAGGASPG